MKTQSLLINKNITIKSAISKMINISSKTLIVVDENKKLLGTVSDGDIRKIIINKPQKFFNKSIGDIFTKDPVYLKNNDVTYQKLSDLFIKFKIDLIPIVDDKKKVINVYRWFEILDNNNQKFKKINIPAVIMAGGKGERLLPLTEIFPKALIPIDGAPIIKKTIDMFVSYSIKNLYLILNHKSNLIKSYLKKIKYDKSIKLNFLKETKPLGTAGGLFKIKKYKIENFILINCDILINYDISLIVDFHKKNKNDLTICVANKKDKIQYGICEMDDLNNLKRIIEKPTNEININTGFYIINKSLLNLIINNKPLNMDRLIERAKKNNLKIQTYKIDFYNWREIGMIKDYLNYLYE